MHKVRRSGVFFSIAFRAAFRERHPEGSLVGITNPHIDIFDRQKQHHGQFQVAYPLPFADPDPGGDVPDDATKMLSWSHTLEMHFGGLTAQRFHLTRFYEDYWKDDLIAKYIPSQYALRAWKRS